MHAIMNLYPPLRLHPVTRGAVNNIITRYKKLGLVAVETEKELTQQDSLFYYGLLLSETAVVTVFKSNSDIAVAPQDINLLLAYD